MVSNWFWLLGMIHELPWSRVNKTVLVVWDEKLLYLISFHSPLNDTPLVVSLSAWMLLWIFCWLHLNYRPTVIWHFLSVNMNYLWFAEDLRCTVYVVIHWNSWWAHQFWNPDESKPDFFCLYWTGVDTARPWSQNTLRWDCHTFSAYLQHWSTCDSLKWQHLGEVWGPVLPLVGTYVVRTAENGLKKAVITQIPSIVSPILY